MAKTKKIRNDCRQIAIGMAFDQRGLPLAREVFDGNFSDTKTLIHILGRLRHSSREEIGIPPAATRSDYTAGAGASAWRMDRGWGWTRREW